MIDSHVRDGSGERDDGNGEPGSCGRASHGSTTHSTTATKPDQREATEVRRRASRCRTSTGGRAAIRPEQTYPARPPAARFVRHGRVQIVASSSVRRARRSAAPAAMQRDIDPGWRAPRRQGDQDERAHGGGGEPGLRICSESPGHERDPFEIPLRHGAYKSTDRSAMQTVAGSGRYDSRSVTIGSTRVARWAGT